MAGDKIGRKVTLTLDGTAVATGRTKSLTINNSVINVTDDEDLGLQMLLSEPGEKSVEISIDGMVKMASAELLEMALGADLSTALVLSYGSGNYDLSGTFMMTSYSESVPYNDAVTFSASFSSSGAVVKAAVA